MNCSFGPKPQSTELWLPVLLCDDVKTLRHRSGLHLRDWDASQKCPTGAPMCFRSTDKRRAGIILPIYERTEIWTREAPIDACNHTLSQI